MATLEGYEHDCGVLRIQAGEFGEEMMDRVDAALGVATRHFNRIHAGHLYLVPAVEREIVASIERARKVLGLVE